MNGVFKSCEARKSAVFVPYIISLFSDDEDYKMARRAKPKVKKYKGIQSDRKFSKKGRFSFFLFFSLNFFSEKFYFNTPKL